MIGGQLVAPAARDRQPAERSNGLDDRRFAGAVLADEESDRRRKLEVEAANDTQVERTILTVTRVLPELEPHEIR